MTGNEPEVPGGSNDDIDGANAGETRHGSMIEAQNAAAQDTRDERARRADAGDEQARAEQSDAERNRAGTLGTGAPGAVKPDRVRGAAEWLDGKLVPKLGGAEVGPYDEESEESVRSHDACPLCGHPMGEHQIDRSHPNAVLICPGPPLPERQSFEPLNEVGMIKRRPEPSA